MVLQIFNSENRKRLNLKNLAVILVITAIGFAGCTGTAEENEKPVARYVKVEKVNVAENSDTFFYNGKLKEKSSTLVSFRVGGPLVELQAKVGEFVQKGQIIARIDKRDYELNLATKKVSFLQSKSEYERYKELYERKKLPENTLEKLELAYLMNKAGYENAENQLKDTDLRAPISGYVFEKMVENHETVGPGKPIVSIIDRSQIEVVIHIPESHLQNFADCSGATCNIKNVDVKNVPLQIISVSEKAGIDQLFEVRFKLGDTHSKIVKPGMTAEVNIDCIHEINNQITIPVSSVFHQDKKNFVWIYNNSLSEVQKRAVVIGNIENNGRIQINEGLKVGEQIVTGGVHSIIENQKVKPIEKVSKSNAGGLL